eukprot:4044893-Heterocapsa_arctica.AAC.1
MKRNRANDAAAIRAGTVGSFGKAMPALGAPNAPGPKAQKKAAAKAAAKALAASSDVEARVLAAYIKGAGKGKGKGKEKGKGKDFKHMPCWFYNNHANGCTKSAAECTHKHIKVSAEAAALLYKPGSTGAGNGTGARQ